MYKASKMNWSKVSDQFSCLEGM